MTNDCLVCVPLRRLFMNFNLCWIIFHCKKSTRSVSVVWVTISRIELVSVYVSCEKRNGFFICRLLRVHATLVSASFLLWVTKECCSVWGDIRRKKEPEEENTQNERSWGEKREKKKRQLVSCHPDFLAFPKLTDKDKISQVHGEQQWREHEDD